MAARIEAVIKKAMETLIPILETWPDIFSRSFVPQDLFILNLLIGLLVGTLHTLITVGVQFSLFQYIPTVVGLNPVQTAIAVIPFTLAQLAVLLLVKRRPQLPHRYLLRRGC